MRREQQLTGRHCCGQRTVAGSRAAASSDSPRLISSRQSAMRQRHAQRSRVRRAARAQRAQLRLQTVIDVHARSAKRSRDAVAPALPAARPNRGRRKRQRTGAARAAHRSGSQPHPSQRREACRRVPIGGELGRDGRRRPTPSSRRFSRYTPKAAMRARRCSSSASTVRLCSWPRWRMSASRRLLLITARRDARRRAARAAPRRPAPGRAAVGGQIEGIGGNFLLVGALPQNRGAAFRRDHRIGAESAASAGDRTHRSPAHRPSRPRRSPRSTIGT